MLKVNLISILEIDEVGQKLSNQFNLFITWYDFRLKLYNMKENLNMNTLTQAEKGTIWVPKLVFTNTKKKDITQNDEKSFAVARRDSNFEYSSETVKYNIFIFDGKNNPFVMSRVYDVDWICDYDMRWYPFDSQVNSLNPYLLKTCLVRLVRWCLTLMETVENLLNLSLRNSTILALRI